MENEGEESSRQGRRNLSSVSEWVHFGKVPKNLKSGAKFGNVQPPELCIELAMPLFQDDDNDRQRLLFSHQYLQPKLNISFCLTFEDKNCFGKINYVIKDKKIHDCKFVSKCTCHLILKYQSFWWLGACINMYINHGGRNPIPYLFTLFQWK